MAKSHKIKKIVTQLAVFLSVSLYGITVLNSKSEGNNDHRRLIVSVKDIRFGAKGDGVADDTVAIQKAVNWVYANGGGVIVFPVGTYMVTTVNIRENITYQGLAGAVIKRPPKQPRYTRTFTNARSPFSGTTDSRPLIIKGLTFDGNLKNQGAYQKYELEHADLLFLTADSAKPGRLRAIVEDCTFKNGPSDGIAIWKNVNLKVVNCTLQDIFRSGLSMTGGYSIGYLKNVTTGGDIEPASIHTEVDCGGYGGSWKIDLTLEDVNCTRGRFDMGFAASSTLNANRVKVGRPPAGKVSTFQLYGSGTGSYNFTDCTIYVGYPAGGGTNCAYIPGTTTFTRCIFISTEAGPRSPAGIYSFPILYWSYGKTFANQSITFTDCTFTSDGTVAPTIPKYGVRYTPIDQSENNRLVFTNCIFTDQLDIAVGGDIGGGGKLIFTNTNFNVVCRNVGKSQKYPIMLTGYDGHYNWDVTLDGCKFNTPYYIYIYGYSGSTPCTKNYLRQGGIIINRSSNKIGSWAGILNNNFVGLGSNSIMRVIKGTGDPDAMPGFKSTDGSQFDQYQDLTDPKNPIYYKCSNMNPYGWTRYTP